MSRYINKQKSENLKTLAEAILIWIFDEQDRVKDEGKLVELRLEFGIHGYFSLKAVYFKDGTMKKQPAPHTCKWDILQSLLGPPVYRYFSDTSLYRGDVSFSRDPTPEDILRAQDVLKRYKQAPSYECANYEFQLEIKLDKPVLGSFTKSFDTEEKARDYTSILMKGVARGRGYVSWEWPDFDDVAKSARLVSIKKE
jgi:hypothetical protein